MARGSFEAGTQERRHGEIWVFRIRDYGVAGVSKAGQARRSRRPEHPDAASVASVALPFVIDRAKEEIATRTAHSDHATGRSLPLTNDQDDGRSAPIVRPDTGTIASAHRFGQRRHATQRSGGRCCAASRPLARGIVVQIDILRRQRRRHLPAAPTPMGREGHVPFRPGRPMQRHSRQRAGRALRDPSKGRIFQEENGAVERSKLETNPVFSILDELEEWAANLKSSPEITHRIREFETAVRGTTATDTPNSRPIRQRSPRLPGPRR